MTLRYNRAWLIQSTSANESAVKACVTACPTLTPPFWTPSSVRAVTNEVRAATPSSSTGSAAISSPGLTVQPIPARIEKDRSSTNWRPPIPTLCLSLTQSRLPPRRPRPAPAAPSLLPLCASRAAAARRQPSEDGLRALLGSAVGSRFPGRFAKEKPPPRRSRRCGSPGAPWRPERTPRRWVSWAPRAFHPFPGPKGASSLGRLLPPGLGRGFWCPGRRLPRPPAQ